MSSEKLTFHIPAV